MSGRMKLLTDWLFQYGVVFIFPLSHREWGRVWRCSFVRLPGDSWAFHFFWLSVVRVRPSLRDVTR